MTNVFGFIDDLAAIDDGGEFERTYKEVCHPKLGLKNENSGNTEGSRQQVIHEFFFTKKMSFPFLSLVCFILPVIFHLKCFLWDTGQKF